MRLQLMSFMAAMAMTACSGPLQVGLTETARYYFTFAPASTTGQCRPADIPPAQLRIGDWDVPAGTYDIRLSPSPEGYGWAINIILDDAARLESITAENLGRKMDLAVDGDVLISPIVYSKISGGSMMLTSTMELEALEAMITRLSPQCND